MPSTASWRSRAPRSPRSRSSSSRASSTSPRRAPRCPRCAAASPPAASSCSPSPARPARAPRSSCGGSRPPSPPHGPRLPLPGPSRRDRHAREGTRPRARAARRREGRQQHSRRARGAAPRPRPGARRGGGRARRGRPRDRARELRSRGGGHAVPRAAARRARVAAGRRGRRAARPDGRLRAQPRAPRPACGAGPAHPRRSRRPQPVAQRAPHDARAARPRVVPIVNENDTVAVEELTFGDNDNLSALTAALVEADLLVMLTDVAGLFDADPRLVRRAKLVAVARADDAVLRAAGPARSGVGRGGMASKVAAARKAAAAGIPTIIADGRRRGALAAVFDPATATGTLVLPDGDPLARRKHWIAYALRPAGTLRVDAGAERALAQGKRSLLPSGIQAVEGRFGVGACVRVCGPDGREVARGLVSYGAADLERIKGAHTRDIARLLGWKGSDEVIHRDDLVVL